VRTHNGDVVITATIHGRMMRAVGAEKSSVRRVNHSRTWETPLHWENSGDPIWELQGSQAFAPALGLICLGVLEDYTES